MLEGRQDGNEVVRLILGIRQRRTREALTSPSATRSTNGAVKIDVFDRRLGISTVLTYSMSKTRVDISGGARVRCSTSIMMVWR